MNKKDLITRGYFPKELPPPFNTKSFGDLASSSTTLINSCSKNSAKLYYHNHVRYGSFRRKLGIPNPALFLPISHLMEEKWSDIQQITNKSIFTKSKPIHTPYPQRSRSISPVLEFAFIPVERAKNRITGRYILQLAAESISKIEDSTVAILALDARRRARIKEGLNTTKWEQFLVEDELYGEQWLLSYEANRQGYLSVTEDYVAKDCWFSQLKDGGISFYDMNAPLIIPPSENSGPSGQD